MAIVKGIIESHSGKIWAKSILGKGTSFIFTITKKKGAKRDVHVRDWAGIPKGEAPPKDA